MFIPPGANPQGTPPPIPMGPHRFAIPGYRAARLLLVEIIPRTPRVVSPIGSFGGGPGVKVFAWR